MNNFKTWAFAGILAASASAQATLIDFTDTDQWAGGVVATPETQTYGNLSVTVTTNTGYYYSAERCSVSFLACDNDGLGIKDDEITYSGGNMFSGELLTVTFSEAVDLEWIGFLDLFVEDGSPESAQLIASYEDGSKAGTAWESTETQAENQWGWLMADTDNDLNLDATFSLDGITKLEFFAGTEVYQSAANSDFALAAIKVEVPEPATLGLLGFGVLALLGARRRAGQAQAK